MSVINTRNYDWNAVEIRLMGKILVSVEGVAWNHKQEKTAIYGKGSKAIKIARGNESVDGSLSLLQDELEQLLDAAPNGKVIDFDNVDIQVSFAENGVIVRYSIVGVSFTEEPRDHKQNDPVGRVVLPFIALDSRRRSNG